MHIACNGACEGVSCNGSVLQSTVADSTAAADNSKKPDKISAMPATGVIVFITDIKVINGITTAIQRTSEVVILVIKGRGSRVGSFTDGGEAVGIGIGSRAVLSPGISSDAHIQFSDDFVMVITIISRVMGVVGIDQAAHEI